MKQTKEGAPSLPWIYAFDPPESFQEVFSLLIDWHRIHESEDHRLCIRKEATDSQRRQLDILLETLSLLSFHFRITAEARRKYDTLYFFYLKGHVSYTGRFLDGGADAPQGPCGHERFERFFAWGKPPKDLSIEDILGQEGQWIKDSRGLLDVGAVAVEELILAVPPFIRTSGIRDDVPKDLPRYKPFAQLKKAPGDKNS